MKFVRRISFFMALSLVMLALGGFGALKAEEFFYPHRYRQGGVTFDTGAENAARAAQETPRTTTSLLAQIGQWPGEAQDGGLAQALQPAGEAKGDGSTQSTQGMGEQVIGAEGREHAFAPNEAPEESEPLEAIAAAAAEVPVVTADTRYLVELVDLTEGTVTETEEPVPVSYIGLDREALVSALAFYESNPPLSELEQGFESMELTAFSRERVAVCKYYREEPPKGYYLMVADHFIVVCEEDKRTLFMNTDILLERLPASLQQEIMAGKHVGSAEEVFLFLESYSS